MRLEINYREKNVKNTITWMLNNMLLSNQEITEEIKEEIKKYLETNDNEHTTTQNLWRIQTSRGYRAQMRDNENKYFYTDM